MSTNISTSTKLPNSFTWLADAPLFIDEDQISRFYDAVVKPETKEGTTTLEITDQNIEEIKGKLGLEASVTTGELGALLSTVFAFIKPEVKASGEGEMQSSASRQKGTKVELHPITTPQRQLVQLTLHYLVNNQERLFFVNDPFQPEWRSPQNISKVPRELVFLDLPSQEDAQRSGQPETKIIPTAVEFENGKIVQLFDKLKKDGEVPPPYPDRAPTLEQLRAERRAYWQWFDENFSATKAMLVVEEAIADNGRIHWIDYRVPITEAGDTLHLHVSPAGKYDTGVFAYNFVKRGYKHGLRLVGTLRSEPSMNVLAIYDK